jgi:hypothetical protein
LFFSVNKRLLKTKSKLKVDQIVERRTTNIINENVRLNYYNRPHIEKNNNEESKW